MSDTKQRLIDAVLEQIKEDVELGDVTAIEELLTFVPGCNLIGYLPEEDWQQHKDIIEDVELAARYPDAVAQIEVLKKDFL